MLPRRGLMAGATGLAAQTLIRPRTAVASQILFAQPSYTDGIAPHFSVTSVVPAYTPKGVFYLHANQPNPFRADHNFVPVTWDVSQKTGLFVDAGTSGNWQRGIRPASGNTGRLHTAAQIYGPTVGGYLNSADLVNGSPGNRMMISPNYIFTSVITPFAASTSVFGISLDLQVPTATDAGIVRMSNTYAKINLLLVCKSTGARVSFSCGLFANNANPKGDGVGFDNLTNTSIIDALVSPLGKLVNPLPGSAMFQNTPWSTWKTFSFTIDQAQFAAGLVSIVPIARSYGDVVSTDPADYVLSATHLNAELHYTQTLPATLGWSMRNLTLTQVR